MTRFLLRRLALMVATLVVVSMVIFALAQIVPGDVGRTILGPYASPAQVAALDHRLGYDRPLVVRYVDWVAHFVTGRWGDSTLLQEPVGHLLGQRLLNSLQLAAVALVLIVPFSIGMGVAAGLREGSTFDRIVTTVGLSLTAIPEFVSGVILLVIFAASLRWFPVSAAFPGGAGPIERLHHLILPSIPLMFVLFGYIARMARAGTLGVVEAPYYRTAILKGLPRREIVRRHVLRNALPPTITVVGLQAGFLAGGLVVIETLFNYQGVGKLLLDAAVGHDVPVLETTALLIGVLIMVANLLADLSYALLNPRIRLQAAT